MCRYLSPNKNQILMKTRNIVWNFQINLALLVFILLVLFFSLIKDAVAQTRVYPHAPGRVARCPACDAVLLRLVRGPDRAWLDMRGVTSLQVAMPGQ